MSRGDGKKITTLKYRNRATGVVADLEVRLVAKKDRYTGRVESERFVVLHSGYDIEESASSLTELQSQVWARLDAKRPIEWKPHILLKMSERDDDDPFETFSRRWGGNVSTLSFQISIQLVELAIDHLGNKRHRDPGQTGYQRDDWPVLSDGAAMVPDTPQNREAIRKIAAGISRLRTQLGELLSHDNAPRTLAQVLASGTPLLPAPPPTTKTGPKVRKRR